MTTAWDVRCMWMFSLDVWYIITASLWSIVDAKVGDKSTCEKNLTPQIRPLQHDNSFFYMSTHITKAAGMSSTNTSNSVLFCCSQIQETHQIYIYKGHN